MIRSSRRGAMALGFGGALALPTLAGLASWRWKHGDAAALLHDPALAAGRRFAAAAGGRAEVISGDRIRLAREVLARSPALVAGVSRQADWVLIADAVAEAGYDQVALLEGRAGRCTAQHCRPGWGALARLGDLAGSDWAAALASFALNPGGPVADIATAPTARADSGVVLGWVLARRG